MFSNCQHAERAFRWIKIGTLIIVTIYTIACYRIIRENFQPATLKNFAAPSIGVEKLAKAV